MYDEVALLATDTVELARVVPVHVSVTVLKPALAHTKSFTVSAVPDTSESDDVLIKVTVCPGTAGELSANKLNEGRWFTSNGDDVVPVPCFAVLLHRGVPAFPSQTYAYQTFDSDQAESVVVATVA